MREHLSNAVRDALKQSPASLRALAREAGVPISTLSRILSKEREATEDVASALVDALKAWGDACQGASSRIRDALDDGDSE
jgi:lambda repressor-like predicted transcriptional regulator